jgi:hypothetical protein
MKNEEELVCDIINNKISPTDHKNPKYDNAVRIANFIKSKFDSIRSCVHIGKDHSKRGDLVLITNKEDLIIELKVLTNDSRSKGTLCNSSQDILYKLKLIENCKPWSKWRKEHSYKMKIAEQLNRNPSVTISDLKPTGTAIANSARYVRDNIVYPLGKKRGIEVKAMDSLITRLEENRNFEFSTEEKIAVDSTKEILNIARADLKEYLSHCAEKKINQSNFKKFLALIKSGFHRIDTLQDKINLSIDEIIELNSNYYIIYFYPNNKSNKSIFKVEGYKEIKEWIEQIKEMEIEIEGESVWVLVNGERFLQLKFHWRNVYFGIQTPSVEIFDKSDL